MRIDRTSLLVSLSGHWLTFFSRLTQALRSLQLLNNRVMFASFTVTSFLVWSITMCCAQGGGKAFTVADEIGLRLFDEIEKNVHFSPDGNYFAVWSERGLLAQNLVEDSLRFYDTDEVRRFVEDSRASRQPAPIWVINRSASEGRVISGWRWLSDSTGVAFVERTSTNNKQLALADIRTKKIELLTPPEETVGSFDVRDKEHYVYTVANAAALRERQTTLRSPAIVGTGRQLSELLFPDDPYTIEVASPLPSYLKAVVRGRRFEVKRDGARIVPRGSLALSPDGKSLVTKLQHVIPPSWEKLYPPPFASHPYRFHAGGTTDEYVRITLQSGSVQALTDAPVRNGGWAEVLSGPSWSKDGQAILLPGTFLKAKSEEPSRPCVAIVDLRSNNRECVEMLKGRTQTGVEEGFHFIAGTRFEGTNKGRVIITSARPEDWKEASTEYQRYDDGTWQIVGHGEAELEADRHGINIVVQQGLNEPPQVVVANKRKSRVFWDPNPQLQNFEFVHATVYKWRDKEQKEWSGTLYTPSAYKPGQRYPLVIQTHGFGQSASGFRPSGVYPTAFAARALAAVGIRVLQVDEHCAGIMTPTEDPCAVRGYEAAAEQLISDGLVDPEKVGIIGFSRTCFYVMQALTTSSFHFKAASVTDGVMFTYSLYILDPERISLEADRIIGASPFGSGLRQWLDRSPGFNLDRINTPLLIASASGRQGLLMMWEPYAALNHLRKPVDLVMLNTDEHVLTNPAVRMVSQGGSIDWFRFWLQDYEDPDPRKASQYERWRKFREQRSSN